MVMGSACLVTHCRADRLMSKWMGRAGGGTRQEGRTQHGEGLGWKDHRYVVTHRCLTELS